MTGPGPVVVLNGAPRAGKTSIARALVAIDGERTWTNLGVETSRAATPVALQPGIGLRPGGERPDVEAVLPGLLAALVDEVAGRSRAGEAVVVDIGLHEGHTRPLGVWGIVAAGLTGLPAWVVGVRCPLDEVVRRRQASDEDYAALEPDGTVTPAVRRWQDDVHRPGRYDLEVDTSALTPEQAAGRILALLAAGPPPGALAELAELTRPVVDAGLERVARASMIGNQGDRATARGLLDDAWTAATGGPALLRCAVAHALADVQDDPAAELAWDERALAEAEVAATEPPPEGMPPIDALLPSLHLNLADVHRRRGHDGAARAHLDRGRAALAALDAQSAQPHIGEALDRVEAALADV